MTLQLVCDHCKTKITGLHLEIQPRMSDGWNITFFDGSWNGGHYCSVECARDALVHITNPRRRAA